MSEKVSVIVPVYNAQKYLARCIESIVAQTYKNLELILVNDGSTDDSLLLCEEYSKKDDRIKLLSQENSGAGLARNTGLQNATGKFVLFVDSDDYIENTTIEKCVARQKIDNADMVMFGRFNQDPKGEIVPKAMPCDKLFFNGAEVSVVLSGIFTYKMGVGISCWGKMLSLDIINSNNIRFYSERQLLSEDAFFMLQIFAHIKSVSIIPESLYYYCENEGSLSRKYKKGRQALCNAFLEKGVTLCMEAGYPEAVATNLKARYLMYVISGMKRLVASTMPKSEKSQELMSIFVDKTLHSVLTKDVLKRLSRFSRLFWYFLKLRLFGVCRIMLAYKTQR